MVAIGAVLSAAGAIAMSVRFPLVSGPVRDRDGELQMLDGEVRDVRTIAREWRSRA